MAFRAADAGLGGSANNVLTHPQPRRVRPFPKLYWHLSARGRNPGVARFALTPGFDIEPGWGSRG